MNNLFSLSRSIIIISLILISVLQLNSQTADPSKKVLPSPEKKTEAEKINKTAGNKTPSETEKKSKDKKTASVKELSKEQMNEKQKADKISRTLDYGIQKDRKIAINMIKEINDEQLKKSLLQKLAAMISNDSDMEIRKYAVTALGDHNSIENSQAVIHALDDENDDVRIAACYSIGKMKLTASKPKLIEILKKQDLANPSNFTDAVIIALGDLNSPEVIEFAMESVKNIKTSKMVRERLTLFIGKCGSPAQKDFLVSLYKDNEEDMTIRSYAVKSIAKLKINESAGDIKEIIKEIDSYSFSKKKKYYDLYMQSVTALVELGDTDSIPLLMNSVRSDNAEVRYKAINLIKEFNDERTIDILKYKMKNDPSSKVRRAARKALEEKGVVEKESGKNNSTEQEENNNDTE